MNQKSYFKGAAFIGVAEVIGKAKGLILIPVITKYFGAADYGIWSQLGVLITAVLPLVMLGTDSSVLRFLPAKDDHERRNLFLSWLLAVALTMGLASVLLWALRGPISSLVFGESVNPEKVAPLAIFLLWSTLLVNATKSWLRMNHQALRLAIFLVALAAVNVAAIGGVLWLRKDLYGIALWIIAADFSVAVIALSAIAMGRRGRFRPASIGFLYRYGVVLVPAGYAMWGLSFLDRLVLTRYTSLAEIGVYSLSYTCAYLVVQTVISPVWTMYPNTAAKLYDLNRREDLHRLTEGSIFLLCATCLPFVVLFLAAGERIIPWLTTDAFRAAGPMAGIILLAYLLNIFSSYYEVLLGLVRRPGLGTVSLVIGAAVNLAACLWWIPLFGTTGAVWATLLGFGAQLLCSWALCRRNFGHTEIRLPWLKLLPPLAGLAITLELTKSALPVLALSALGGVAYLLLFQLSGGLRHGVEQVRAMKV